MSARRSRQSGRAPTDGAPADADTRAGADTHSGVHGDEDADLLAGIDQSHLIAGADVGWRQPMLAATTDRLPVGDNWLFERKLDGFRALVCCDGDSPALWSRTRKPMSATYPELVDALAVAAPERFVADGEIVAFDGERTSFERLQNRTHADPSGPDAVANPVYLYLFDLLVLGDLDLARLPVVSRKAILREVVDFADPLRYVEHRFGDAAAADAEAHREGWEGLIAKRTDSAYRGGRSYDWRKFKRVARQEFVIGGFTGPQGARQGFGALLVGHYEGETLRYAGKVGTGYDAVTLARLRARLDGIVRRRSPFVDEVREPRVHWVEPELVAEVGFAEWTSDGRLRHPRFVGLREDKQPSEVVREQARSES